MTTYKQERKANTGITYTGGWCLSAVQTAFGTDHKYPTAAAWWAAEPHKHTGTPPKGIEVPIFLTIAGEPAGHVAIWLGDGRVASASQPGTHKGLYIHASITALIQYYATVYKLTYVGWGETVGSVHVVEAVATPAPKPASAGVIGKTLYLPKTATSWKVYPLNKAPVVGNQSGVLAPSKFGGLSYKILANPEKDVVTIQTQDFGKVNIYVAASTGATIK